MKNLMRSIGILSMILLMVSCSEDPFQQEEALLLNDEGALKKATVSNCQEETAWGGDKYFTREKGRNWAIYMDASQPGRDAYLVAGQKMLAGFVNLHAEAESMTIVISLKECWSLQKDDEPIKIQALGSPPEKNPPPGKFTTFKGVVDSYDWQDPDTGDWYTVYTIEGLKLDNYYLVHVDVMNCCK